MNTFRMCTVMILALCATGTFAAAPKDNGFYLVGALGVTELDDDGAFSGLNFDDEDSSIAVAAGYKILPYFAVEGRVSDLGEYEISGFGSTEIAVDVVSVHAVGIVPFGTSGWEMFGQLGFGRADIDTACCGSEDETVGSAGIGVRYYPNENVAIGLQIDAYAYEDDSSGTEYDPGIVTSQFSIQYLF